MKFIPSFLIVATALSASTCFKLSVGKAALTPEILYSQNNTLSRTAPIDCKPVTQQIPTQNTIKCDLPTPKPTSTPDVSKSNQDPNPKTTSAVPEPASYALLGAGLMTVGFARRLRKKAQ